MLQKKLIALCLMLVGTTVGCNSGKFSVSGPTGTVSGKATLDGKPVSAGSTVTFRHTTNSHTPAGIVSKDGTFTLQLAETLRVPVGVYAVSIMPPYSANSSSEDLMKASLERDKKSAPPVIPAKYHRTETSPIKLEVVEGANTLEIKLTSE